MPCVKRGKHMDLPVTGPYGSIGGSPSHFSRLLPFVPPSGYSHALVFPVCCCSTRTNGQKHFTPSRTTMLFPDSRWSHSTTCYLDIVRTRVTHDKKATVSAKANLDVVFMPASSCSEPKLGSKAVLLLRRFVFVLSNLSRKELSMFQKLALW